MKISQAKELLTSIVQYNLEQMQKGLSTNTYLVPMFVGDPGVGKTAIPNQVASELGLPYHQTIIAQYDAGEMAGLPFVGDIDIPETDENGEIIKDKHGDTLYRQERRMVRMRPTYLPDPAKPDGNVAVWNLDELPQAFLANQNICSQLVNEYRIGEHEISPGITMCCTGNKPENKAGTTTMPMHLRDRLMFIEIQADDEEFLNYAATKGIDPLVRAYLRKNPGHLHKFQIGTNAFPSPRSWEKVSAILSMNLPKAIRMEALQGQVGEGETTTFEAYIRVADRMPDPHAIIADPENPSVAPTFGSKDADILFLLVANLADMATPTNVGNIIRYMKRLENKEFVAMWAKDALTHNKKLHDVKEMKAFKLSDLGRLLF